jgi:hypothetical protein
MRQTFKEERMRRILSSSMAGGALAICLAASAAGAAPAAGPLAGYSPAAEQSGMVEPVHRRWRKHWRFHHYPHWGFRRCHWDRVCWWDRWGYRHCDVVRKCRPRWW